MCLQVIIHKKDQGYKPCDKYVLIWYYWRKLLEIPSRRVPRYVDCETFWQAENMLASASRQQRTAISSE